jgi:cyanate lyase
VLEDRKTITPPNEIVLPPFPPTFAKSKFGLKLTYEELRQRSLMLDVWMRALLVSFMQLNHVSKDIVFEFLNLDSSQDLSTSVMTTEEKYYINRYDKISLIIT